MSDTSASSQPASPRSIEERRQALVQKDSEEQDHEQRLRELEGFVSEGFSGLLVFSVSSVFRKFLDSSLPPFEVKSISFAITHEQGLTGCSQVDGEIVLQKEKSVAFKQKEGFTINFNATIASEDSVVDFSCALPLADIPSDMSYHCNLEDKEYSLSVSSSYQPLEQLLSHHRISIEQIKAEKLNIQRESNNSAVGGEEDARNEDEVWEEVDEEEEEVQASRAKKSKGKKVKFSGKKSNSTAVAKPSFFSTAWTTVRGVFKLENFSLPSILGFTLHNRAWFFFGIAAWGVRNYGDYASV